MERLAYFQSTAFDDVRALALVRGGPSALRTLPVSTLRCVVALASWGPTAIGGRSPADGKIPARAARVLGAHGLATSALGVVTLTDGAAPVTAALAAGLAAYDAGERVTNARRYLAGSADPILVGVDTSALPTPAEWAAMNDADRAAWNAANGGAP